MEVGNYRELRDRLVMVDERAIFLAFDYGTRNIGVAVGQMITVSAAALTPLVSKNLIPPWDKIDRLVESWQPDAMVVGVPYTMNGEALEVTGLAQEFMGQLRERYELPVYPSNEILTTKAAREELFQQGGYRALQNESIDSFAAKIILEEWLRTVVIHRDGYAADVGRWFE